jgi:hypothetical protein
MDSVVQMVVKPFKRVNLEMFVQMFEAYGLLNQENMLLNNFK